MIQALAVIGPVFLDASKTPAVARAHWRPSTVTQDGEDNERSHLLFILVVVHTRFMPFSAFPCPLRSSASQDCPPHFLLLVQQP